MATSTDALGPVLHVVVVGFHHKKGCQVRWGEMVQNFWGWILSISFTLSESS